MQREVFHTFKKPLSYSRILDIGSLNPRRFEKSVKNLPLHVGKGTIFLSKKTDHSYGKAKIDPKNGFEGLFGCIEYNQNVHKSPPRIRVQRL